MTEMHQANLASRSADLHVTPEVTSEVPPAPLHHTSDHQSHGHHRPGPQASGTHATPQPAPPKPATPQQAARPAGPPSRPRLAGFVFLFVYPLVTGLLYLILPLMQGQPLYVTTLVVVPIVVVSMVWGIIPFITTRLRHLL